MSRRDHECSRRVPLIADGYRESTESRADLLRDVKRRRMQAPSLVAGDGALAFWSAVADVFPETRHQRDWVHKTMNVLDCLPAAEEPGAKKAIFEITNAENKGSTCAPPTPSSRPSRR